jgi:hypothetical protein
LAISSGYRFAVRDQFALRVVAALPACCQTTECLHEAKCRRCGGSGPGRRSSRAGQPKAISCTEKQSHHRILWPGANVFAPPGAVLPPSGWREPVAARPRGQVSGRELRWPVLTMICRVACTVIAVASDSLSAAADYATKPYSPIQLLRIIRGCLGGLAAEVVVMPKLSVMCTNTADSSLYACRNVSSAQALAKSVREILTARRSVAPMRQRRARESRCK